MSIAQRLRDSLKTEESKGYPIEFSVGSIEYKKEKHQGLEDMLILADSKMYHDKKREGGKKPQGETQ